VPETTPTNPIVTVVHDLVADGQQVRTQIGTPVNITLSGYSPAGHPLAYTVHGEPLNGALTGTPPNLTYTPAAEFEGLDGFEFTASDGENTSLPAAVTVIVNPWYKRRFNGASFAAAPLNLTVGAGAQRVPQLCNLRAHARGRQRDLWQVQRDVAQATESALTSAPS
jgi:hypothetical protein